MKNFIFYAVDRENGKGTKCFEVKLQTNINVIKDKVYAKQENDYNLVKSFLYSNFFTHVSL